MGFMTKLRQAKAEITLKPHPFVKEDLVFRYAYIIGLAIIVYTDETITKKEMETMEKLHFSLNLPTENIEKAFAHVKEINGEILREVVNALSKLKQKVFFLLDLYKFANLEGVITKDKKEVIKMFYDLLEIETKYKAIVSVLNNETTEKTKRELSLKTLIKQLNVTYEELDYYFDIDKQEYNRLTKVNEKQGKNKYNTKGTTR